MEIKKINLKNIKVEDINPTTLAILALTEPLVRLKGKKGLYRLWYTELNGPTSICIAPEKSKDHNNLYWSCSYYRPDEYGKNFEIEEIVQN